MNQLIENAYTVFSYSLNKYNQQRAEKIELGFVGICQEHYVFAGDWQNLFLFDKNGGIEIYLKCDEPKSVSDIEVNWYFSHKKKIGDFNFKTFIKWLYKRNLLIKQINWTNLKTIKFIQKCGNKIEPFESNVEIDKKTGKIAGITLSIIKGIDYSVETYKYNERPHCIIRTEKEQYKFYLPDKKPKTQKEMEIIPNSSLKKSFFEDEIKYIKSKTMQTISDKINGEKHCRYYELLLLYRTYNPDIKVGTITPIKPYEITSINGISFCDEVVKKYAEKHNLNPYKILSEMYEKGYIDNESRINQVKNKDFIKEYSYLCDNK